MYEMNAFGTLQSVFDEVSKAERPNPDQLFTMLETMAKNPVQHEDIVRFLLFANQKERDRDKIFATFLVTGNKPSVGKRLGKYSNLLATLYNSNSLEAKDLQTLLETIGFDVIAEGQPVPILLMMLRTDDLQEMIFKAIDSKILGDNLNGDLVRDNVALMINILYKLLETTNLPPIPGTILILFEYGKIKDYLSHKDRDKVLDIPWLNMMFRYADGGVAQTQLTNVITQLLHAPGTNIEKLWYRLSPKVRRHTHDQLGHNAFYWMENHFSEENTLRILNGFISAYQRKINTIGNADDSLKQLGQYVVNFASKYNNQDIIEAYFNLLSDYIQKIPEDSQGRLKAILGPDKLFIASLHNKYQVEAKDSQSVLSEIIDILGKVENLDKETRLPQIKQFALELIRKNSNKLNDTDKDELHKYIKKSFVNEKQNSAIFWKRKTNTFDEITKELFGKPKKGAGIEMRKFGKK